MKAILSNAKLRRWLITHSTVITQAREGIDITLEEAERSYDEVIKEKKQQYDNRKIL